MWPTQESCLIGRLRVGLLRGDGELSEAEKKRLRSFSSTPTGLDASGSEGRSRCGIRQVEEQREARMVEMEGETEKHESWNELEKPDNKVWACWLSKPPADSE